MKKPDTHKIRFGHSPDPDDAFMFYAIAKDKINTQGLAIDHVVEDIESLNQRALKAELEATAVSVHAYAYLTNLYSVMRAGASIGDKYGPIIVSKKPMKASELSGKIVAIPGILTTAALVLKLFKKDVETQIVPFDKILDYVAEGKVDAGVVIHEGQLTYGDKKLHKIVDLGEWWWKKTKLPLPLGVDVVRKDLGKDKVRKISKIFKESIVHGLENRKPALDYAIKFGRGLKPDLNDKFVGMYVNDYTVEMGKKGETAIKKLFQLAHKNKIISEKPKPSFV